MAESTLPVNVVETDHRLEMAEHKASEALSKHRWHWTLDESNPGRVSVLAYARAVGRSNTTISTEVNGYAAYLIDFRAGTVTKSVAEYGERARVSAEKEAVIDAVAQARGVGFKQARQYHPTEVKRVRQIAQARAEQNETTVAEEAPKVADWIVKSEKAETKREEAAKQKHSLKFVQIEADLRKMLRIASNVLNDSHGVPFTDEEKELLAETIGKVRALLNLIDLRFADAADIDWDAELTKIVGA